jgi:hypothetical protein
MWNINFVSFFHVICMNLEVFVLLKLEECHVDNVHDVNALILKNMVFKVV